MCICVCNFHAKILKALETRIISLTSKPVHIAVLICTNSAQGQENEKDHGTNF